LTSLPLVISGYPAFAPLVLALLDGFMFLSMARVWDAISMSLLTSPLGSVLYWFGRMRVFLAPEEFFLPSSQRVHAGFRRGLRFSLSLSPLLPLKLWSLIVVSP